MIVQTYNDVYDPLLCADAIPNDEFHGFGKDYMVLHALVKKIQPKTIFEIGTNRGSGTKILKNAAGPDSVVFTLDLPPETMHESLWSGKRDLVGINCTLPFVQLRGDSMTFDFSKYPCEFYYVDAEHEYDNVFHETTEILKQRPKIIVYHDADIIPVWSAIVNVSENETDYKLYRVTGTRIAYLLKKEE